MVKVEHVNKVIEILGRDNVELRGKLVKQIVDLMGKVEMLEVEDRIEEKMFLPVANLLIMLLNQQRIICWLTKQKS